MRTRRPTFQAGEPQLVSGIPNAGPAEHSLGAIWGSTTTVVDFAPVPNEGDLAAGIHDFISPWKGNAYTDYTTHCIYSNSNTPDAISRYKELIDAGFPSVKIFTTDIWPAEGQPNTLTPLGKIDAGRLEDVMSQIARHGGVLAVHGEDDEIVMYNYLLARQKGAMGLAQRPPDPLQDGGRPGFQERLKAGRAHRSGTVLRARHGPGRPRRYIGSPQPGECRYTARC